MAEAYPSEGAALAAAWDDAVRTVRTLPPRPPLMPAEHASVSDWLAAIARDFEVSIGAHAVITPDDVTGLRQVATYVFALERHAGGDR